MPIRISGAGTGRPYLRYSPQKDEWVTGGGDEPVEIDVTQSPLIFDIAHMQLGWLLLDPGVREWAPWPHPTKRINKPDGDYKVGFECAVFSKKLLRGIVHDYSSNAIANTRFMEQLYNEVEADLDPTMALAVQITGTKARATVKGKTREILYDIIKWVPRPAEFDAAPGEVADDDEDEMFQKRKPVVKKTPPSPPAPARPVAKPAPRQAEVADEADEF